ncbi:MAG: choice-of-anchor B family protein [Bacteroidia bacterium]|nr:choice-of-anchor B family protein [Bacteroidia bacterium]MBP6649674.1 choice-of-anchor B family protein [Bacteroidia bacterium]
MKKAAILCSFLLLALCTQAQYDHHNINLLGKFNDPSVTPEPTYGIRYQSCYGWVNPNDGREYGIIGSTSGTYIIEVSDPSNLVQRDYVPGRHVDCIWHEFKTYGNYLYIISDDGGNNSLQIADLSFLPDSVAIVYDGTSVFTHAHTLYVEGDKMYVASVSKPGDYSSMNVYSLANPTLPVLLRRLDQDYPVINQVHDMFVVNDTVYASCGYDGLHIYKFDETTITFQEIGNLTSYPDQGYNHSSYLSTDHSTLYMCDEVPDGMAIKVVDVTDVANPAVATTFSSNAGNTPHNPYVQDNLLVMANYQDGIYIYDITTPTSPALQGFFDTHPQNTPGTYPSPAYAGAWAAYTNLPSGVILASDMQYGLFVLDISPILGINNSPAASQNLVIYPNPASTNIKIKVQQDLGNSFTVKFSDLSGRIIREYSNATASHSELSLDVSDLSSGMYFVEIRNGENKFTGKFFVNNNGK